MDDRGLPSPRILSEAARRYGVEATELHLVRYVQNAVYSFLRDGATYYLRLTDGKRKGCEEIVGELDWIRYLAGKGLPVCQPVSSLRGRLFERVAAAGQAFVAAAFAQAKGKPITAEDLKPALFGALGQLLGRLHAATREYRSSGTDATRADWYRTHGLSRDLQHLPLEQMLVRARIGELIASLRSLPEDRHSYGLIHGDINYSNCHLEGGQLELFDFDNCQYGYLAADIGTAIFECAVHVANGGEEMVARFWPTFWSGYCRENPLDPFWLTRLPDFIRLRDAWVYVHFHRVHDMPHLMARDERVRRDFQAWRQRIEEGAGPVDVTFA